VFQLASSTGTGGGGGHGGQGGLPGGGLWAAAAAEPRQDPAGPAREAAQVRPHPAEEGRQPPQAGRLVRGGGRSGAPTGPREPLEPKKGCWPLERVCMLTEDWDLMVGLQWCHCGELSAN